MADALSASIGLLEGGASPTDTSVLAMLQIAHAFVVLSAEHVLHAEGDSSALSRVRRLAREMNLEAELTSSDRADHLREIARRVREAARGERR